MLWVLACQGHTVLCAPLGEESTCYAVYSVVKVLIQNKSVALYLQEFQSMEHFKQELIEYLDYYNNRRIKAKLKGLPPAIHRQQALSAA